MIEIKDIEKRFKRKAVLNGVSLTAEAGEIVGIVGSNGSGKSTLFSILSGILKAEGGDFLYNGESLFENTKKRSSLIGFVPQSPPLFEELSAKDNLSLAYKKSEMQGEVIKMLGIDEFLSTPVRKMSGGMKKRLSIALAVAHSPRLLFLDEPSAALDIICREKIKRYLLSFKESGGTVLLATHDLSELEICDKIYLLKNGKTELYEGSLSLERALTL